MKRLLAIYVAVLSFAVCLGAGARTGAVAQSESIEARPLELQHEIIDQARVNHVFGLSSSRLIRIELFADKLPHGVTVALPIDDSQAVLELEAVSVRSLDHRLLVQQSDGSFHEEQASASCTFRGHIAGESGSSVAASIIAGSLHACIMMDGEMFWIEPIASRMQEAPPEATPEATLTDVHVVYKASDVKPLESTACGMPNLFAASHQTPAGDSSETATLEYCTADLACDSDVEYFNQFGSVEAVEAHVESIVNFMNLQYESQLGIHHDISQLIVRTAEPDPYTATDSLELLCELTQEWTNNLSHLKRDMTMLFSGHDTGDVVGRASNFGDVCNDQGCCECGLYGTDGSYCYARTEWDNGSFAFATAVTAHELGHLWGAYHCDCAGFTMHYTVPIGTFFSADSIPQIEKYRASLTCLTCASTTSCIADFNGDGEISILDLLHLIDRWGPCAQPCPPTCTDDTDGNCLVNVMDLIDVLETWGPCP